MEKKKNGTPGSARAVRLRGISKLLQTAPPAVILDGGFSPEKVEILEDPKLSSKIYGSG
jgi:hypothetical protein